MKYRLCYIRNNFAYFTRKPLNEQWGDDWNDAPYEHNAGEPYEDEPGQIKVLAFKGDFVTPEEAYAPGSPYSIEDINNGRIYWLKVLYSDEKIYAGASIKEFIRFIEKNEGQIFVKRSRRIQK